MKQEDRIIYDTHEAVRSLTAAGMPEPQAEAVVRGQAHLIEYNLATKADIAAVQADVAAVQADIAAVQADIAAVQADVEKLRLETRANIAAVQADVAAVQADVEKLRLETRADIEKSRLETKADIEVAKNDLTRWMIGMNLAAVTLIIAAFKLL